MRARIAAERCLGIDDNIGCTLRIVKGQVWITVDGHLRDIIANAGDAITLVRGARTYVSAFRDAVVRITPASRPRKVAFAMLEHYGLPLLSVTADRRLGERLSATARATWAAAAAAFVAFSRRRFLATLAAV